MTCFSVFSQTDGASAVLIMSEEKALAMGFKPKAYLRYLELILCIGEVFFFTLNSIRMSSSFILLLLAETLSMCPRTPKTNCFWGKCIRFHFKHYPKEMLLQIFYLKLHVLTFECLCEP